MDEKQGKKNVLSYGPDLQRFLDDAVAATDEFARTSGGKFSYVSAPELLRRQRTSDRRSHSTRAEKGGISPQHREHADGGTVFAKFASCWTAGNPTSTAVFPAPKTRPSSISSPSKFRRSFSMYTRSFSSRFS